MKHFSVVLAGQPNVGKSSLINALSGAKLRVGNFSGVTIEKAQAILTYKDYKITMIDLPGTYSLHGYTMEEKVCKEFLLHNDYDVILNVLDSTNLERNLILTLQLQELQKPMVVALNMIDEAKRDCIEINSDALSNVFHTQVCAVSSVKKENLESLLDSLITCYEAKALQHSETLVNVNASTTPRNLASNSQAKLQNPKVLQQNSIQVNSTLPKNTSHWHKPSKEVMQSAKITSNLALQARQIASEAQTIPQFRAKGTAKIDSILLHRIWGFPIFLLAMFLVFQISFVTGKYLQDLIQEGVDWLGDYVALNISNELLSSLIGNGIIKGVGTVVSFLPLIATLFLGLTLLEGSGYMARVAFMLDGLFFKFGLHGKSFIPLVMGFGCSVPAYMAARTLHNKREKLLTLFIIGFMSCSARLPIYLLFVGAFFPIEYAGIVLFAIYLGGVLIALILAKILRIVVFRGESEPFVMEMPRYRFPTLKVIWFSVWGKSYLFLKKAGTVILAGAIFVWVLANFPKSTAIQEHYDKQIQNLNALNLTSTEIETRQKQLTNAMLEEQLEYSFAGRLGHVLQPIFAPLGFDWRLSVSLVTGFSAKEMVVSTLGVLYALGGEAVDDENDNKALQEVLRQYIDMPAAIAFILFIMLYIPCFAATIAFGHESGKKIYMLYLFIFTTCVAYFFAYIGHEIARLILGG